MRGVDILTLSAWIGKPKSNKAADMDRNFDIVGFVVLLSCCFVVLLFCCFVVLLFWLRIFLFLIT